VVTLLLLARFVFLLALVAVAVVAAVTLWASRAAR
jgi:hypothetical protein